MYWGINPYTRTKQHRFEPLLCGYWSLLQIPMDYQPGYTHLPSGGEKKKKTCFGIEVWFSIFLKKNKNAFLTVDSLPVLS